jgi:hypothetical protein
MAAMATITRASILGTVPTMAPFLSLLLPEPVPELPVELLVVPLAADVEATRTKHQSRESTYK